jgi:hypothetical protein
LGRKVRDFGKHAGGMLHLSIKSIPYYIQWIKIFWEFFIWFQKQQEVNMLQNFASFRSTILPDQTSPLINFNNIPLIPTKCGKLFPYRNSRAIMPIFVDTDLLRKIGFPQLDVICPYNALDHKEHKGLTEVLATINNIEYPLDFSQLSKEEIQQFLQKFYSTAKNIKNILIKFPLFENIWGEFVTLEPTAASWTMLDEGIPFVPHSIPALLKTNTMLKDIYTQIGVKIFKKTQFYLELIFPKIASFSKQDRLQIISQIAGSFPFLCIEDNTFRKKMEDLAFIDDGNTLKKARDFVDPNNVLMKDLLEDMILPKDYVEDKSLYSLVTELGLVTKVDCSLYISLILHCSLTIHWC